MWGDLGVNILVDIIASVVLTAAGWLGHRAWAEHRRHYGQERVKLTYYRVLRFALCSRGDLPYYQRRHHAEAIARREGPYSVYDEVWCLNAAFSRLAESPQPIQITSRGIVDAIQVLPVVAQDADNHPHTRDRAECFTAHHAEPTTQLVAAGTLINGIQLPSERWFATTAQYEGQTLVLVADFSSLPFATRAVQGMHASVLREKRVLSREQLAGAFYEERLSDDLYIARLTGARKGDVVRIDFRIDEALVPPRLG